MHRKETTEIEQQPQSKETHWEAAARTQMGRYLTAVEQAFILSVVDLARCQAVMDVGAEAGRISQLVKDRHLEAIGIDIEAYGLKRLRLKNPKVNLILSDARKIPMRRRVLDAIFMIEVLDYIPELETVLSECRDALKPGGRLVLSFGNLSSLKSKFRLLRGRSYRHSYVRVLRCLAKTRFTIIRQTGYNWLPFSRVSDIPVIPTLAKAERFLGLRRMCGLSPWVLVCAVKSK